MRDTGLLFGLHKSIKAFNPHQQPRSALANLVLAVDVVLGLLETLQASEK